MAIHTKSDTLVVDIDDTLSWTVGHWVLKLIDKLGNPEKLTPNKFITKYQYVQNVPYWKGEKFDHLVNKLIHSNKVQTEFPIIKGSKEYLCLISRRIKTIVYVSKRPESVRIGTLKWLKSNYFPKGELILKPLDVSFESGNSWKSELIKSMGNTVIGVVDDDQKMANFLNNGFDGLFFLFGHRSTSSHYENIIPCPTWQKIYCKLSFVLKSTPNFSKC